MNVEKMDKEEVALQWMAALRSGDYVQAKNYLRDLGGFCCLGVAAEVYRQCGGDAKWLGRGDGMPYQLVAGNSAASALLPYEVQNWLGIDKDVEHDFVNYNDVDELSFEEIAEQVEEDLLGE
jgi:hypothetical protein